MRDIFVKIIFITNVYYKLLSIHIDEIRMKIKGLVYRDEEVRFGFEKALGLIERKLGLLLDFSKHVEELNEAGASEEEIRVRKRCLDYEFGTAVNMCHVVDYFIIRKRNLYGRVFDDVEDFNKYEEGEEEEMRWFKTQMDDFTEAASSFGIGKVFLNQDLHGEAITPSPSSNINYENKERLTVIGLEVDEQVLARLLVGEMNKTIWIVGAKGIGKTTLATKVWENIIKTNYFELRFWVTITQEFHSRDILQNLMKQIPERHPTGWSRKINYSTATTLQLAEALFQVFSSVRCLVVLDGLRTYEALEALGERKISKITQSRIMITTRSRELADPVKFRNHIIHEMRTLSDQEAWELFNAKVPVPKQLQKLGRELVRKCMGLPLDIVAVGDILLQRAVTEEQWLKVLNQCFNQNQQSVFNELEVAVDNLPSHRKHCLSSFELFNHGFDVPMRRLIVYWVAEGHVQQEGDRKKPQKSLPRSG